MEPITLSRTGLQVSRLCFGAMTFGGQTDEPAAVRMVDCCLDHGINFFDTANVYTGGASEQILGRALQGRRNRVILASKVGAKIGKGNEHRGLARTSIRREIEGSLQRLGTDYLDLYYMHVPDYDAPLEETLSVMNELVREGKVRHIAQSNYAAWQACQMLWISDKNGWAPPLVSQPMYNLLARGIEQEYLPMCKEFGIATVVYNPLAGGLLTGKHTVATPIAGSRFDKNEMYLNRYWHTEDFDAVDALRAVALRAGRSLVSLALNWLLHHTQTNCVILGASRIEQLQENLAASEEGPVQADTLTALDDVWKRLRGVTPQYNR
jgi:aryl-alcohol dehydrogenase-like predicted oxidoreductase